MTVSVGDRIPDIEVKTFGAEGPEAVRTGDVLGSGRVVLFAVPGAFTPGCSKVHLPGYVQQAAQLSAKGVDKIVCVSVNDAFVMKAWADDQQVGDKILMLADGAAAFTKAMGLEIDLTGGGMGVRSQRYAAIINNGVIEKLLVEPTLAVEVSSCSAVYAQL
ncbi:MAG: peroxiredoxin [Acidimicrobiia bacterium]|jgi:peroxiredoxin